MVRRWVPVCVVLVGLLLAACGGAGGDGAGGSGPSLDDVYAAVEGLTGDERRARLVELAEQEEGSLTFYTSMNVDESGPLTEMFADAFGIEVDLYRASASTVAQRALQEADADFRGADLVMINGPEMILLDQADLLAPLRSPVTEHVSESVVFPTWSAAYLNVFTAVWNSDEVSAEGAPETWEEVLTQYSGRLAMELGDADWFAALVKQHFVGDLGWSEEEAVALFEQAAEGALVVDGHTLMAELLASGAYDVAASAYHHRIVSMQGDDAPLTWEPAVEPLVVRPNGIGIHAETARPAAALLFLEFTLDDAQPDLAALGRTPANQSVEGGVAPEYELISVDLEELDDEREKWITLYEEIVSRAGSAPAG